MGKQSRIFDFIRPRWVLVICAIAVVLRLLWVSTLSNTLSWEDERGYVEIAGNLTQGKGFISSSWRSIPGYPFFLSVLFRIFGQDFSVARVSQCILGGITCWLIFLIGAHIANRTVGLLSAAVFAVYLPHIYLAGVLYSECVVTFLLVLSVWLAVRSTSTERPFPLAVTTGIVLGATTLTRSVYLLVAACICLMWLSAGPANWRKRLGMCGAMLIACALTILPWTFRNYLVFERFVPVSSGFSMMLWRANNELSEGNQWDRDIDFNTPVWNERFVRLPKEKQDALREEYTALFETINRRAVELGDRYLAQDEALGPLAISYIKKHPLRVAVLTLRRAQTFFTAFTATNTRNQYTAPIYKLAAAISFYPVLALAIMGTWISIFRRKKQLLIICLLIGAVTLAYSLLGAATRYRLPLDPFLILLAAVALDWLITQWKPESATVTKTPDGVLASPQSSVENA